MQRYIAIPALCACVLAGCATRPPAPVADWAPSCTELGCFEEGLAGNAPVGAELSFSQCRDRARYAYRYVREDRGWKLVSWKGTSEERCD